MSSSNPIRCDTCGQYLTFRELEKGECAACGPLDWMDEDLIDDEESFEICPFCDGQSYSCDDLFSCGECSSTGMVKK